MRFIYCCQTDTGTERKNNQDSLVVKSRVTREHTVVLAAVCDGVGGLACGGMASRKAADMLSNWFDYELPQIMVQPDAGEAIRYRFRQAVQNISGEIYYNNLKQQITSATTLTALVLWDNQYLIGHAGDSRIYEIGRTVRQLTKDHSWVAKEVSEQRMTEEQARRDPRKNIIFKCAGAEPDMEPDILKGTVRENIMFVLCTDGFWHHIRPEEWKMYFSPAAHLTEKELSENLYYMTEQVKFRGESDNITAIAIYVY